MRRSIHGRERSPLPALDFDHLPLDKLRRLARDGWAIGWDIP
jgi:hypothetical protein